MKNKTRELSDEGPVTRKREEIHFLEDIDLELEHVKAINKLIGVYGWKPHKHTVADVNKGFELMPLNAAIHYKPDGKHMMRLLHETGEVIRSQHQSQGYVIYLADEAKNNIFICPICENEFFYKRYCYNIEQSRTIAVHVYRNNEPLNVSTLKSDIRFPHFQDIPEIFATNIATLPITDFQNEIVGVFEVFRDNCMPYDKNEFEKFQFLSKWIAEGIQQNKEEVTYKRYNEITNLLTESINDNFKKKFTRSPDEFLSRLVVSAKISFDAESATVFLKNPENELYKEVTTESLSDLKPSKIKLRLTKELQLAKITSDSHVIINYNDVCNDPRFNNEIDVKTGKIIRTVLASPMSSFGTLQVLNKINDEFFTSVDDDFMKTFAECSSLWLYYRWTCVQILNQTILNNIMKELIFRKWSAIESRNEYFSIDETIYMPNNFLSFEFHPFPDHMTEISKFIYYMILTACKESLTSNRIPLYNFVNIVKKCFVKSEFTNFENAFTAVHFIFVFLKRHEIESQSAIFSEKEKLALMISALCLYIDCNGRTTEYLECTRKDLVDIYGRMVIEKHQIWLTKYLIETSGIIAHFCKKEEEEILKMIEENLLGFNIQIIMHLDIKFRLLIEKDLFDIKLPEHTLMIRHLLMSCAANSFTLKKLPVATKFFYSLVEQINREKMATTNTSDIMKEEDPEESLKIASYILSAVFKSHFEMICKLYQFMDAPLTSFYKFFATIKN